MDEDCSRHTNKHEDLLPIHTQTHTPLCVVMG